MSIKYHLNTETGRYGPCGAKSPDSCPLTNSGIGDHFDSMEEAETASVKNFEEKHGAFAKLSKKGSRNGTAGYVPAAPDFFKGMKGPFPPIHGARIEFGGERYTVAPVAPFGRLGLVDEEGNSKDSEGMEYTTAFRKAGSYDLLGGPEGEQMGFEAATVLARTNYLKEKEKAFDMFESSKRVLKDGMSLSYEEGKDPVISVRYRTSYLEIQKGETGDDILVSGSYGSSIADSKDLEDVVHAYGIENWNNILDQFVKAESSYQQFKDVERTAEENRITWD